MNNFLRKKSLLLVVALMISQLSFGLKPVYVSPTGSDSGEGSFKNPVLTLKKARDLIRSKKNRERRVRFRFFWARVITILIIR